MRTTFASVALAGLVTCGAVAVALMTAAPGVPGDKASPTQGLRVGAVCEADFPFATEVSCGLVSFGDVRFRCPEDTRTVACPRTRAVTVKNTGPTALQIITISGSGPGERYETVSGLLRPEDLVTVRPRAGDTYLYDIVLRARGGRTRAKVTELS